MEKLKLMKPNKNFENQVLDMVQEFYNDNSTPYWSSWIKKFFDNYSWWLDFLRQCESENSVAENIAPSSQYILVREFDNKVIWFMSVRHRLNDKLLECWGHIWYSIRPSERRKHYALWQFFKVLNIYKDLWIEKILAVCDKSNIRSAKIIQNCGWILENEIIDPTDWELIQRYWIDVKEWIEKWKIFFSTCGFDIEII